MKEEAYTRDVRLLSLECGMPTGVIGTRHVDEKSSLCRSHERHSAVPRTSVVTDSDQRAGSVRSRIGGVSVASR